MYSLYYREWWWVVVCCLSVSGIYFHFIEQKKHHITELTLRLNEMEKQEIIALQEKENLQLQLNSQNDPSWIEMILMRDLGVVPQGWIKVHFINPTDNRR